MAEQPAATTIVVGMDFSEQGERALDAALRFAAGLSGADVHVLHVDMELTRFASGFDAAFDRLEDVVQRRCDAVDPSPCGPARLRVFTHLRGGAPATQIVQLAADLGADLLVVGTRGKRGLERLMLGSVAEAVVRGARCPVWIVRPRDHERAAEAPGVEAPCPRCAAKREESLGEQLWCATHLEKYGAPHRLTYER